MQRLDLFQVEIRTRDLQRAMAFYGGVFDWRIFQASPDYALVDSGAMPVIAILETRDPNFPLGLCNNVLAIDCQREADRAVELGGSVCVRRTEMPGSGAFIGTLDPWGNELFFWQPFTESRPSLKGSGANPIVYLEIATSDLPAAIDYYTKLVGWSFWSVVFGDGCALAEGCGLQRGVGLLAVPAGSHGTTSYIAVANLADTAAKVRAAGGQVLIERTAFPGEGWYMVCADLDGNRIGLLERLGS